MTIPAVIFGSSAPDLGHTGWRMFFNDCFDRLSDKEPLILHNVAKVEVKDGTDVGGAVRYEWEKD